MSAVRQVENASLIRIQGLRPYLPDHHALLTPNGNGLVGVSVEVRQALVRIRHPQQANVSTRFVSFEPLLDDVGTVDLAGIHWAIAGGESGPGARPVEVAWVRRLRDHELRLQRVRIVTARLSAIASLEGR